MQIVLDSLLVQQYDMLVRGSGKDTPAAGDDAGAGDAPHADAPSGKGATTGSIVRLKAWKQRTGKNLGYSAPNDQPVPLIDQVHRLMHLWKSGDVGKVNGYLDERGLRRNTLFLHVLQALIELAPAGNGERSLLESISNHVATQGVSSKLEQDTLF